MLILAWFFAGAGIALNIWTDMIFKRKKTTVKPFEKPTDLIVTGPFRISRHPMYLGFVLILLGLAVILENVLVLVTPFMMVWTLEAKFIPTEENNLEEQFGQRYLDYKKQVRRWI